MSPKNTKSDKTLRLTLASLLLLLALNAFGGGIYGMSGAKDVPLEWLKGSPFSNYFIPSLFLFVVIGGSALIAAIAVLKRLHLARKMSLVCGCLVITWIIVQVIIIGYVSWLQPASFTTAIIIIALSGKLHAYGH